MPSEPATSTLLVVQTNSAFVQSEQFLPLNVKALSRNQYRYNSLVGAFLFSSGPEYVFLRNDECLTEEDEILVKLSDVEFCWQSVVSKIGATVRNASAYPCRRRLKDFPRSIKWIRDNLYEYTNGNIKFDFILDPGYRLLRLGERMDANTSYATNANSWTSWSYSGNSFIKTNTLSCRTKIVP